MPNEIAELTCAKTGVSERQAEAEAYALLVEAEVRLLNAVRRLVAADEMQLRVEELSCLVGGDSQRRAAVGNLPEGFLIRPVVGRNPPRGFPVHWHEGMDYPVCWPELSCQHWVEEGMEAPVVEAVRRLVAADEMQMTRMHVGNCLPWCETLVTNPW